MTLTTQRGSKLQLRAVAWQSRLRSSFACLALAVGFCTVIGCNKESDDSAAAGSNVSLSPEDVANDETLNAATADSSAAQAAAEAAGGSDASPSGLSIGDPNPGLKLAKFVKGDAVTAPLKDDVTVVEFWATWCGPCVKAIPELAELHRELGSEGVSVVGVTDERAEVVQRFLSRQDVPYGIALDRAGRTRASYEVVSLPTVFVIGRDGRVVDVVRGAGEGPAARIREATRKALDEG